MNKLLFFIFGYILFQAQGGFPERFINLCHVRGVKLRNLKSENGVLYAATSLTSFRKIRFCAKKSGMRIKILEKKGLPFFYARLARHSGVFIGTALCAFLLFFYSRSVWRVDIKGNESISSEHILEVLEKNGVHEGTLKKDIDYHRLQFALYDAMDNVAWLNVGIDGSRLILELREVTPKPEKRDSETYCNIIASRGGVVDKMQVYEGEAVVREGDGVSEGEMLVSGVIAHEEAKRNTFHRASADIFAYTQTENTIAVKKAYRKTSFTGRQKRFRVLRIFRLRLPLYLFSTAYRDAEVTLLKKPVVIAGVSLPLALEIYDVKETVQESATLSKQEAAALARGKRRSFEKSLGEDTKILERKQQVTEDAQAFYFTDSYSLYENIAKKAQIMMEED